MTKNIKFLVLAFFLAIPVFNYAQVGKISGTVIDRTTGEPLIGANVVIQGTSLGAATDVEGSYIILNITPGNYIVKARYIGYQEEVIQNNRISVNLTSEINFSLLTEDFETETVVVIATKPLVDKNITNSTSLVSADEIDNLPVRGVNALIAQQAGVVTQTVNGVGNIHVRGSRPDATAFYIDGVLVSNPVFGGAQSGVINNAIEEIQVQSGGYSAEYGGANGGIISTQTRTGKEQYNFTVEAITDNFISPGEEYLGGYSYGYSEYVFTAGGPVIPSYNKLKFYVAGNNTFRRSQALFWEGMQYDALSDPTLGENADVISVDFPDGYQLGYSRNGYQILGNLLWDLNPFSVRLNANFRRNEGRNGIEVTSGANDNLNQFNALPSAGLREDHTFSSSLKLTHVLGNNAFYDVIVNYFTDLYVDMDPFFKHNITAYGDSILNAEVGRTLRANGSVQASDQGFGFSWYPVDRPIEIYRKQSTDRVGGKFSFLYQANKNHELKAGAEFDYYLIRRYSLGSSEARGIASSNEAIADGNVFDKYSQLDNYGYDVFGNKYDVNDQQGPKNPIFGGVYVQDKMEFSDLVLQVGFRLDYIDIDGQEFIDANDIKFNLEGEISDESLRDVKETVELSPRLGFSFPVTDRTVFHAQYGKFIQQSRLRDVYQGANLLADNIKGGLAISQPVGFGLKPEQTTSYEIGFRQQLGEVFAFDITGFYKDIKDQVQIRSVFGSPGAQHSLYYAWVNGDFATVKGIELKLDLRRTGRLSGQLSYTYSDAKGTGSTPSSAFRSIWQSPTADPFFPQQIAPLDFNQANRGFLNLDYRYGDDEGILSNFGANMAFSFTSGFNFTRWDGFFNARIPQETLNSSTTPWTYQIDLKMDKTFYVGDLGVNVYLWVTNLLNTKNVVNVFNTSGDAEDDGWLASPEGNALFESYKLNHGQEAADLYAQVYRQMSYDETNFGPPRQINLGIKLTY